MVSNLISPTSNTWKENAIKSVFDPHQANRILCVPLPKIALSDTVIWRGDHTRELSVKFGYRMLNDCIGDDPSSHLHSDHQAFFNRLWQSNIPSKIKITIWRFAKNYIPTLCNLSTRHINVNTSCILCKGGPKSVDHLVQ
ncbi:hypothetical protein V6N12_032500 [Hibiscus sabdariffa]|uniref:Reverse transcriptase zinc-binding domain-containing protein n=1 Tax=Hibiscus sabdariffa TaxID=183260 RepID=A0ABR2CCS6_9ROSI